MKKGLNYTFALTAEPSVKRFDAQELRDAFADGFGVPADDVNVDHDSTKATVRLWDNQTDANPNRFSDIELEAFNRDTATEICEGSGWTVEGVAVGSE